MGITKIEGGKIVADNGSIQFRRHQANCTVSGIYF